MSIAINDTGVDTNVKIEILRKNKVIKTIEKHNLATIDLCKYLRDAIAGVANQAKRPQGISPCRALEDGTLKPFYGNYTLISGAPICGEDSDEKGDFAYAILPFIIPYTSLQGGRRGPDGEYLLDGLQLFNLDNTKRDKLCAELILDEPLTLSQGVSLRIEWVLKVRYNWLEV